MCNELFAWHCKLFSQLTNSVSKLFLGVQVTASKSKTEQTEFTMKEFMAFEEMARVYRDII